MVFNMNYIWYSNSTSVTGKQLAELLGIRGGTKRPPKFTEKCIVWGARLKQANNRLLRINRIIEQGNMLNNIYAVERTADKLNAMFLFKQLNIPPFTTKENVIRDLIDGHIKLPLVARGREHYGGKGFRLLRNYDDIVESDADIYTQFIDSISEYRIHIFRGEVIRISKKVPICEYSDAYCRSHANGWRFAHKHYREVYEPMIQTVKDAINLAGLDFGAGDVLKTEDGHYLLEINTGVGLADSTLERYVGKIEEWLNV